MLFRFFTNALLLSISLPLLLLYFHSTAAFFQSLKKTSNETPVVLWHGMGDSCCNPLSMGYVRKLIRTKIPGIYVLSLMLGGSIVEDTERGFLANMNEQIVLVCEQLKADPMLSGGYNAIGFSQGGLFMRALAQRCPNPPIKNLISFGGPQQGVFGLPFCTGSVTICNTIRRLLDYGAYESFVQRSVVQAQYWHDPNDAEQYRGKSIFLADLNCETNCNNKSYKRNILALRNFVLVQFLRDKMIQPRQSAWFGFYAENQSSTVLPMNETRLYKEDLIGLKTLKEADRLHFLAIDGEHLQIPSEFFIREIINKYLKRESGPEKNENFGGEDERRDEKVEEQKQKEEEEMLNDFDE